MTLLQFHSEIEEKVKCEFYNTFSFPNMFMGEPLDVPDTSVYVPETASMVVRGIF